MPKKDRPIKIRKTWLINPETKIKEDKHSQQYCERCGMYEVNPDYCKYYCVAADGEK